MTHLPGTNVPQTVEHALVWVVAGLAAEQAESETVTPFAMQETVLVCAWRDDVQLEDVESTQGPGVPQVPF